MNKKKEKKRTPRIIFTSYFYFPFFCSGSRNCRFIVNLFSFFLFVWHKLRHLFLSLSQQQHTKFFLFECDYFFRVLFHSSCCNISRNPTRKSEEKTPLSKKIVFVYLFGFMLNPHQQKQNPNEKLIKPTNTQKKNHTKEEKKKCE